jgi:hypothetical protein
MRYPDGGGQAAAERARREWVRFAATADWVSAWIGLTAERLPSCADEGTVPQRP